MSKVAMLTIAAAAAAQGGVITTKPVPEAISLSVLSSRNPDDIVETHEVQPVTAQYTKNKTTGKEGHIVTMSKTGVRVYIAAGVSMKEGLLVQGKEGEKDVWAFGVEALGFNRDPRNKVSIVLPQ